MDFSFHWAAVGSYGENPKRFPGWKTLGWVDLENLRRSTRSLSIINKLGINKLQLHQLWLVKSVWMKVHVLLLRSAPSWIIYDSITAACIKRKKSLSENTWCLGNGIELNLQQDTNKLVRVCSSHRVIIVKVACVRNRMRLWEPAFVTAVQQEFCRRA